MLKTKVFLSCVTNLSDARYAAGMGVDYIGFNINPESKHYVTSEQVKTISDWVSGVSLVGEIDQEMVTDLAGYGLGYILTSNAELVSQLDQPILKINPDKYSLGELNNLLESLKTQVSFFIIEISGDHLDELSGMLKEISNNYPVYLATDFESETISTVLETIRPMGIVIYGSEEEKPGLSSYDGIADILEQLELE